MSECIFCKIINGDIPSRKVYEDDDVLAFLDISQVTKGHTLVIAKEHVRNLLEFTDDQASVLFSRIPAIARAVKNAHPDCGGLNMLMNSEEIASQSVFHAHVHLLPRYSKDSDGFGLKWIEQSDAYSDEELDEVQAAIKHALKNE